MKMNLNNKYIDIKVATSFKDRLIGLMGKTNIDYGILFPNCNSIHTYFMKEPIDVIALDNDFNIIFIENSLSPNKIYSVKRKLNKTQILELPQNSTSSLKLGQKIKIN